MDDVEDVYELLKQLCIEALYSRELSGTAAGERDGCASAIRKITKDDLIKRKQRNAQTHPCAKDQKD